MQQYLLSVYQPDGDPPPPEVLGAIMRDVEAWEGELKAAGSWVFTAGLFPPETATVLRAAGGEMLVTDGPFTEGKEHIGGFTVVRSPGLDAALGWGRKLAEGQVLVRQCLERARDRGAAAVTRGGPPAVAPSEFVMHAKTRPGQAPAGRRRGPAR